MKNIKKINSSTKVKEGYILKSMQIVSSVLFLLAGLGVTLFGMHTMSVSLESATGNKLAKLFNKISNKRVPALLIGAGVTAIIQSSGATTIMVVGFVNAGIMTLFQATAIIMGANIGTTVTAQIAALSAFNITPFLVLFTFIGTILMLFKNTTAKNVGVIFVGLGLIFIGLDTMSSAMKIFRENEAIIKLFSDSSNHFLLLFIGLVFTAALQSSSAVSTILITMSTQGLIGINSAAFAILGANIGSCISAVIASIGANENAKRATLLHITFNTIGATLFYIILSFTPLMDGLKSIFKNPATTIAMFHTIFNVSTAILLLPFIKQLCMFANKVIKTKKTVQSDPLALKLSYVDSRLLNNAAFAISQIRQEIIGMAELANNNLNTALEATLNLDLKDKELFEKREAKINYINRQLAKLLVKVNSATSNGKDKKIIGTFYHVISDIERIGDYAENIFEYAEKMQASDIIFSDDAKTDIREMVFHVEELYKYVILSFKEISLNYMDIINREEDCVDAYQENLGYKHIERLEQNKCSPENGALFLSLISNLERIADHMLNVAVTMKDYVDNPSNTNTNNENH